MKAKGPESGAIATALEHVNITVLGMTQAGEGGRGVFLQHQCSAGV